MLAMFYFDDPSFCFLCFFFLGFLPFIAKASGHPPVLYNAFDLFRLYVGGISTLTLFIHKCPSSLALAAVRHQPQPNRICLKVFGSEHVAVCKMCRQSKVSWRLLPNNICSPCFRHRVRGHTCIHFFPLLQFLILQFPYNTYVLLLFSAVM